MLEPSEIRRGMVMHINASGMPDVIHGNRREQVKQLVNAVSPPRMAFLSLRSTAIKGLSCPSGGDSSVRERDLDAGAAEVDHRDQCFG